MSMRKTQRGFLLIVAVILIAVAAVMAVVIVTLTAGSGQAGAQHVLSTQSLYITESGLEYEQRQLAQNVDWYRSTSDPAVSGGVCPPNTVTLTVGLGTVTVCRNFPATMLQKKFSATPTPDTVICAYTVDRFPTNGSLQIDDDIAVGGGGEFVDYTGTTTSLPACGNLPAFTGVVRGLTKGGVVTSASNHVRSTNVYPLTTLTQAGGLPNSCATPSSFQIADNSKFLDVGTINLDDGNLNSEQISYSGSTRSGGTMTLTGVLRCQNGTSSAAWAVNFPVTPLLAQGIPGLPQFEAEIFSTGTVSSAMRVERKTVQRF